MVSNKIARVNHMIDMMLQEGVNATPSLLRSMRVILEGAQASARELEGCVVPRRQRLTAENLADGKVAMFPVIARPSALS